MVRLFRVDPDRNGILEESDGSPLDGHSYSVNHVEFSKDGSLLASCSLDGWTLLWNPEVSCDYLHHSFVKIYYSADR